ncbi:metallophosphoesterase [Pseudoflavonifractor capillosus]|uniref:DUF1016 N-terminal domain-containing protein n=1 Tax=Pseudoflavonifractor capillosus TaxID=106588 RepID=UPI00195E6FBB|nr:DUF1016 N-terminal domain-containing protein [Pseudoflavonifractor capillosus]MBM6695340.1 metallophosphoesterase [Pseudoflavonifractor capillosus]
MNIRKNVDYSPMFDAMRVAMSSDIPQMNLYYELGRLICQRTEKGAAVAAAEYLQRNYPDVPGLSPRNLRRMRDFYRVYEENPELLDLAMEIGWTQNVVILEADLNTEEQRWYLCAARRRGWSKAELQKKIQSQAHREVYLDELDNRCYTECESTGNGSSSEELQSGQKVCPGIGRQQYRKSITLIVHWKKKSIWESSLNIFASLLQRVNIFFCASPLGCRRFIMRFYILSDLHLRAEVEAYKTCERIKRLCSKIRQSADFGENILFIILGDIADKGNELSFATARDNLSLICDELKDYAVEFEFVPGNHDIDKGSLSLFDQLTSFYGCKHTFEFASVYSNVHDKVNFIFADSTLSRDYTAPGRLDLDAIRANVKHGLTNILFCHHALSHGHGDPHDVIEDSATVIAHLNSIGISYFFHGHVHDAKITVPENGLVEIGCGSLSGGIDWLPSVFHQFLVGYIQDGRVALIERWIDAEDGYGDFALNELYPKPKIFSDPDKIGRISYTPIADYIPRWVSLYEDANKSSFARLMAQEKRLSLRSAVQKHKKILLLCDAGIGKSIELSNLAHELSDRFHTFLYPLENYTGQEIQDLLPVSYRQLPPNRIALLLDGYDELESKVAKTFRNKLKSYTQDATAINIVISSRSNFCGNESSNESQTFPGFYVYTLEKLDEEDVRKYLKFSEIDANSFWNCAYVKGVSDLVFNPFYLVRLSRIYTIDNDLPPKNQLMDRLITETFEVDDRKFSGELDDQYLELFSSLEMLALAMQLMHRQSFDDREEYQTLVSAPERSLIKKSGLLRRESTGWKFSHNNFREYLAAKCLSRLPKDFVIPIFYDGTNIKPHWANTLGYLTGFDLGWSLIDWLMENSPSALVKFEPDRLDLELRIEVFKRIFNKFERLRLHFNDDLCNPAEFAHFVNSNEILSFLLDRISAPRHHVSQYTAVNLLRHYPSLFDKENAVRNILLDCCDQYPTTHKTICRLAMLSLCQHNLQTPETTRRLMEKFSGVDEDYIRLGIYEYLLETGEHNSYVEYILSGIGLIAYRLGDPGKNRIGNESFELVNCLKQMSTVYSVTSVLKWFSQEQYPDFYAANEVLASTIASAVALYNEGHTELFTSVLSFYLESTRVWNTTASNAMVKFFLETGTQYSAVLSAAVEFEAEPYRISDLVYADSNIIDYLKTSYLDGSLKSHRAFYEIVLWYVRDELKYVEYADLIRTTDGVDFPNYKAPIDYNALNRKSTQEYFEILFDEEKRDTLTAQLLNALDNPDVTTKHLLEVDLKAHHYSALLQLRTAMYHSGYDVKVSEFFDCIDIDTFVIQSASRLLSEKSTVVPTRAQKAKLAEITTNTLMERNFKNSLIYYPEGVSLKPLTAELLSVIMYLDYSLDETSLLDLTELPAYIFDEKNERTKYIYLRQKLPINKLNLRLIQNVATQRVKGIVLTDHIDYFNSQKDASIAEYALEICKDSSDTYLRSTAWRYLYNTLGAEYITSEILPIADEKLLLEIAGTCKDIPKEKMCKEMEREYEKTPSLQLQARLITYGSSLALDNYVKKVTSDKKPPEGAGVHIDGPTAAISSIRDFVFLPQLEALLKTVLDPAFEDNHWHGLRSSLTKAFVNCGTTAAKETIEVIMKWRPSADVDEKNYRFCNYTIEEIRRARKFYFDIPKTLLETKKFLGEVKNYY